MAIRIFHVDAFTSSPFGGNPAAVCILDAERPNHWMQGIAAEMNLSETAFLLQRSPNLYNIRWMTPMVEVDLCGHATLASAHVLFEQALVPNGKPISFISRSGPLAAELSGENIELSFPLLTQTPLDVVPEELRSAVGANATYFGKGDFDYLIELENERTVRQLQPDLALLKQLNVRGVVVTAKAEQGREYDFVSRGFFPGSGIDEDPVTGSAHCMLGPYWLPKLGKTSMTGYQASKRGGYVKIVIDGKRVRLKGKSITISSGEILV